MCICIDNIVIIILQAPNYQYAKNINCNVTIVNVYTEKIDEKVKFTGSSGDDRSESLTGGIRNDRSALHDQTLSQIGALLTCNSLVFENKNSIM